MDFDVGGSEAMTFLADVMSNVAEQDARRTVERGFNADNKFGERGSQSHDGKAYDDGRNF